MKGNFVSRPGGTVRFASGKVQRYTISKLGYPRQGGAYVLFLKWDEQGDFSVLTGYELRNNKVVPLDGDKADPEESYSSGSTGARAQTLSSPS
jgi:hypothetical protein